LLCRLFIRHTQSLFVSVGFDDGRVTCGEESISKMSDVDQPASGPGSISKGVSEHPCASRWGVTDIFFLENL
jgi:hypothetical protein